MSEEKRDRIAKDYLNDILENIKDIYTFIENMDFEDLKSDKKTQCNHSMFGSYRRSC